MDDEPTPIIPAAIDLFSTPPVNIAEDKVFWVDTHPSFISREGTQSVQFSLPGTGTTYVDLARTELYVQLKIIDPANPDVPFTQTVELSALPIDLILQTMWSSVDIKLNGTLVSFSGTNYMYKSFLENLLTTSASTKQIQQSFIGCSPDRGNFGQTHPDMTPYNEALKTRRRWFNAVAVGGIPGNTQSCVEFCGKLFADICTQERFILDGVRIDINFIPNTDEFRLLTYPKDQMAKIRIEKMYLKVCKVHVDPRVTVAINNILDKKEKPALYPIQKTEIRTHNIPQGSYFASLDDIFQGDVPNRLVIGMVNSEAYAGSFSRNPFFFEDFGISKIKFTVDNVSIPTDPLDLDFSNCSYLEGLSSLYRVSGKLHENTDLGITRINYREGLSLFGFEVDPSSCFNNGYLGKIKKGTSAININFKKALDHNITVIVFATFPEIVEIDYARVVRVRNKELKEGK